MEIKTYATERELLNDVLLGDQEAVEFCLVVGQLCQYIDDVRDDDMGKYDGQAVELEAFYTLFALDHQPFYHKWKHELQPVFKAAFMAWTVANSFERSGDERLQRIAYVFRDLNGMLAVHCAMILGGVRHAMAVGPAIWWNLYKDETFEEYQYEFIRRGIGDGKFATGGGN